MLWVIVVLKYSSFTKLLQGGYHLLQKVTVHSGIHNSVNEFDLSSSTSTHVAPNHDATTTMFDCRHSTLFLVLFIRSSPYILYPIRSKPVDICFIKPQDMLPVGRRVWIDVLQRTVCEPSCGLASVKVYALDDAHAN